MRVVLSLIAFAFGVAALAQPDKPAEPEFKKPEMTKLAKDARPFEYVEAKVPFYPPSKKWGVQGDPTNKMQKPLSVEESLKHIVTPVDFQVKVFVTEEKLGGKPIAMNWDEQGRLFVSITVDYPNELQREGEGRDKIVVCEDENGDGTCDKVTTFADKLSIATSVLPFAGGLIVHQAPVTLFLKDTDGDGKADVRRELLSGWATNDTHAGPSNLHYGFDNWIYGAVGYAGFKGEVNGERHSFKQGFYRFRVEKNQGADAPRSPLKVTKLEFLRSTNNNTWGLCFDESGELFGSTANGHPLVHMPIPNRYYEKVKGLTPAVLEKITPDNHFEPITEKVRQVDWHGGFTAASNCAIYTARTYPREYWNRTAFVSEPTGHLTAALTLQPSGTTFRANYGWNLLASDDEWCAPIDARVGPDGHVWVIDWYNFIVQHNPTPAGYKTGKGNAYETELRDKTHGRIYRVVYTKAKPEPRVNLKDATPEKLVETLKHHNMTWRLHAQRLLIERGKADVVPALVKLLEDKMVDDTGLNAGAVHALYTLDDLVFLLADDERDNKLRKLIWDSVSAALRHPAPKVRWAAARFTSSIFADQFLAIFTAKESDLNMRYKALMDDSSVLLSEWKARKEFWSVFASRSEDLLDASYFIAAAHAFSRYERWLATIVESESMLTPQMLRLIEIIALNHGANGRDPSDVIVHLKANPVADAVIAGWASGWRSGTEVNLTVGAVEDISKLLPKLPPASRGKLLKLASTWGVKGIEEQLAAATKAAFASLADAKAKDAERVSAAQQVIDFQPDSDDAAAKLLAAVTPESSDTLAAGIFEALSTSKAKGVGVAVVAKVKDLPPAVRPAALRLVLAKADSTKAFLDAVEKGTLRFDLLALDQKTALASHPDKDISERAKKILAQGGGLPNPDRQKVIEELKHILTKTGNVDNGKKMFTQHCAKCHKHGNEGTTIGPDLSGFGVHPKEEILIHVLDPSRSVEGNFKLFRVTTTDDRTILGILGAQTATSTEIIDADAKKHALAKEDIASLRETDKSLMPEGFEKVMKVEELIDLMEFLTRMGKFVPLPLDKVATIVSTKGMFVEPDDKVGRLVFPDWKPKVFEGVPFVLVDPGKDTTKNVVMLHSENGKIPPTMPKSVSLPYDGKAKAIHILGGIGGWAAPFNTEKTVSMIVRVTYDDGKTEDHELKNAVHIADYIGKFDVSESKFAFALGARQVRYLAVTPKRPDATVKTIEFVKGADRTAPIVMAVTVETP